MRLEKKRVLVFGTGISGIGACRLLEYNGAEVILYDGNAALDEEEIRTRIGGETKAKILLGELSDEVLDGLDLCVISPGVPTDLPIVRRIEEKVPVWSEIELAYETGKGEVLAITGTNGKTTTTALLGEIMKAWKGENVFVVGNIGIPYTSIAAETDEDSVIVAEISSFQLETIHAFKPVVSAVLNITPDHLDRHHTMEAYIEAKESIARNQGRQETCVLNYEDEVLRKFGENTRASVLYFSSGRTLNTGVYLDGDVICLLYTSRCV